MKSKNRFGWISILTFILLATLAFSACNTSAPQNLPAENEQPESEVFLPSTGSDPDSETEDKPEPEVAPELESEDIAYPDSEKEIPNSDMTDATQGEAYPEPEEEAVDEATPAPEIEPTKGPQPTSRGAELHATSPTNFSLASGQVQLVELFAFW